MHPPLLLEPLVVTGTLGEFRNGNFHYGLDFSTGGETGAAVHAIADGHVRQIMFGRYNIGYAVRIEHDDGPRLPLRSPRSLRRTPARSSRSREDSRSHFAAARFSVEYFRRLAAGAARRNHRQLRRNRHRLCPSAFRIPGSGRAHFLESAALRPEDSGPNSAGFAGPQHRPGSCRRAGEWLRRGPQHRSASGRAARLEFDPRQRTLRTGLCTGESETGRPPWRSAEASNSSSTRTIPRHRRDAPDWG